MAQYIGKYRGTVLSNIDPEMRGRLLILVPDVSQLIPSTWAEPCVPLAGPTGPPMGVYMVPPVGAGVWVEFEHGDPNYPIWVGCRWGAPSDVPPLALTPPPPFPPNIVIQSLGQNTIMISDVPALGIVLKTLAGASVMINDTGIYIQNTGALNITSGTINITGSAINLTGTVNINGGALIVT